MILSDYVTCSLNALYNTNNVRCQFSFWCMGDFNDQKQRSSEIFFFMNAPPPMHKIKPYLYNIDIILSLDLCNRFDFSMGLKVW